MVCVFYTHYICQNALLTSPQKWFLKARRIHIHEYSKMGDCLHVRIGRSSDDRRDHTFEMKVSPQRLADTFSYELDGRHLRWRYEHNAESTLARRHRTRLSLIFAPDASIYDEMMQRYIMRRDDAKSSYFSFTGDDASRESAFDGDDVS